MFINWLLFVRSIVPEVLQKSIRLAWLDLIVSPLRNLYNQFRSITDDAEFATKHSGIKIYFEKALNDKFDPLNRSITIDNVNTSTRLYIYSKREPRPKAYVYMYGETTPMYVKWRKEYFGDNDFIVNISSAVVFNVGEFQDFINSFKPVGKRYTINVY